MAQVVWLDLITYEIFCVDDAGGERKCKGNAQYNTTESTDLFNVCFGILTENDLIYNRQQFMKQYIHACIW